jgi:cell division protein FtsW
MQHSKVDKTLLFCLFCLLALGIVFVYSSSYYRAMTRGEDSTYYMLGHMKRLLIASVFFFLGFIIPYRVIKTLIFPLLVLTVIVLILTLLIGRFQFGARRSLAISSFGLQISEFVRIWLVFFLANFFSSHPKTANSGKGILIVITICLFLILLVAIQPSISMALICLIALIIMLIYGGTKFKLFVPTIVMSCAIIIIVVLLFPHAQDRITGFITHPTYQVQQSLIAIGSGGIFGKGPGAGLQKFLFLPRIYNDFIFSHIAEEFGFIGGLIVFLFYWQIYLRGLSIAGSVDDEFSKLLVLGLNASIFVIFLIHVGVSIGLLPPTGIPLPFISFGGWSLSANLFAMGIILQVSRWRIA